jgi:hypothetical protein
MEEALTAHTSEEVSIMEKPRSAAPTIGTYDRRSISRLCLNIANDIDGSVV